MAFSACKLSCARLVWVWSIVSFAIKQDFKVSSINTWASWELDETELADASIESAASRTSWISLFCWVSADKTSAVVWLNSSAQFCNGTAESVIRPRTVRIRAESIFIWKSAIENGLLPEYTIRLTLSYWACSFLNCSGVSISSWRNNIASTPAGSNVASQAKGPSSEKAKPAVGAASAPSRIA